MNPEELKIYAEFMNRYGLNYLEVKKNNFHIILKKTNNEVVEEVPSEIPQISSSDKILEESKKEEQKMENFVYIKSPLVGVFYRAPSPESPPFVEVNSKVKKGDTICIIESMKVMNEIKTEHDGIIKEILIENGKPVEYGQVLFILEILPIT